YGPSLAADRILGQHRAREKRTPPCLSPYLEPLPPFSVQSTSLDNVACTQKGNLRTSFSIAKRWRAALRLRAAPTLRASGSARFSSVPPPMPRRPRGAQQSFWDRCSCRTRSLPRAFLAGDGAARRTERRWRPLPRVPPLTWRRGKAAAWRAEAPGR